MNCEIATLPLVARNDRRKVILLAMTEFDEIKQVNSRQ